MFEPLVKAIQNGVKPEIIEVNGKSYSSFQLNHIPNDPLASALGVATLQAVVDYIKKKIDKPGDIFIHIADFQTVNVCQHLNDDRKREILLSAQYESTAFRFGNRYEQEDFITLLQCAFVDNAERQNVQKVVGGLLDKSSLELKDDGISQNTVAKSGVVMVARIDIENPVTLKPFRTFSEVEQPASPFVLRLHRKDGVPTVSLWEADNSAWKVEAINNIAAFLEGKLPTVARIA